MATRVTSYWGYMAGIMLGPTAAWGITHHIRQSGTKQNIETTKLHCCCSFFFFFSFFFLLSFFSSLLFLFFLSFFSFIFFQQQCHSCLEQQHIFFHFNRNSYHVFFVFFSSFQYFFFSLFLSGTIFSFYFKSGTYKMQRQCKYPQGPFSISHKLSDRKILQSLKPTRWGVKILKSNWNLAGGWAEFRATGKF